MVGVDVFLLIVSLLATLIGAAAVVASFDIDRPSVVLLGVLTVWLAQTVFLGLIAGVLLRALDDLVLLALALLTAVAECLIVYKIRRGDKARTTLTSLLRLFLRYGQRAMRSPVLLILLLLLCAEYGWQIVEIARLPVISYDSLSYHIIGPATWLQHHAIVQSDQSIFADTYPADQGVLVAWIGSFLHTLQYSPFVNFAFLSLGAATSYVLSRILGVRPRFAALAAFAFLSLPPIFLESSTDYVGIAAGTTVVASLVFIAYAWHGDRGPTGSARGLLGYLFLSGCALGLAVGVKSDNLVIIAPVGIAAIAQYLRGTTDDSGPKLRIASAALIGPVVLLGSFWYLRTWVTWKNPFYPITIFGFHGYGTFQQLIIGSNVPPSVKSAPLGYLGQMVVSWLTDLHRHPYYYDSRPGGFGLQWLFFLVPGLAYLLVYTFRHRWEFFWFVCLPVIVLLMLTHEPWMARSSMATFVLGAAGFALILERLRRLGRRFAQYARPLLSAAFVALAVVTVVWASTPTSYSMNVDGYPTYLTFSQLARIAIKGDGYTTIQPWPQYRAVNALPAGATIGFSGLDSPIFTYPLVGTDMQRQLVRLPYSGVFARGLAASLRRQGVRYVVLGLNSGDAVLFRGVSDDLSQFRPLTTGDPIDGQNLYEVGTWRTCERTRFTLVGASRSDTTLTVAAKLVSSCGPEAFRPVTLWVGEQNTPLYSGHSHIAARAETNASGLVTFTITNVKRSSRYFLRQSGGYVSHILYAPAATAPFTYTFVPIGR